MPYHTEARQLSWHAVLKGFFDLREEIGKFMEKKGKPVVEFQSTEWLQDLAFMVDITEHWIIWTKCCKAIKKVVTQCYDSTRRFELKLTLWETQLSSGDPAHFPCLKDVHVTRVNADMKWYKDKIRGLLGEVERRFQISGQLETDLTVFCSPFTVKASWPAVWFRFEGQICLCRLGHVF